MLEKRANMRLPLRLRAEIRLAKGGSFFGLTRNISFAGVLVELDGPPEVEPGDRCDLLLILSEEPKRADIHFECEVVYIHGNGMGLKFLATFDIASYKHFEKLMVQSSDDPQRLLDEARQRPWTSR